jgi:hypothetical protein
MPRLMGHRSSALCWTQPSCWGKTGPRNQPNQAKQKGRRHMGPACHREQSRGWWAVGGNSPPMRSRAPVRAPTCSTHPDESQDGLEWSAGPPEVLAGMDGWRQWSSGGTPAVEGTAVTGEGLPSYTMSRRLRCAHAHARRCYVPG